MENLADIKTLHQKVQDDIFRILLEYRILRTISYTLNSKASLYFFEDSHKLLLYEMPVEIASFINSVDRLLDTNYIKMVSSKDQEEIFLVKTIEYNNFSPLEKEYFILMPNSPLLNALQKGKKVSYVDEIL